MSRIKSIEKVHFCVHEVLNLKIFDFMERLLPILFWALLIFGFDIPYVAILTIICAVIHEGGHIIALFAFKKAKRGMLYGDISGFRIRTGRLSYKEEFFCAISGPVANIIVFLVLLPIYNSEYIYTFGILNLMSALSNLLPIEGYDGYRALRAVIGIFSNDPTKGEGVLDYISFLFSVIMSFLSLYLMLKIGEGYWIFAVFASTMLCWLMKKQKHAICEKNGDFGSF